MNKKNDWVAINLNAGDNFDYDSLFAYGINPDNTGLQSEDYYKNIKQVKDNFTDSSGVFNDEKFHTFYESAKRSFNDYQQSNFTQKIINEIDSSPYDIFSLGKNIMDTSAAIYRSRDPQRTTMGLGNIFEVGSPTFDIREVAQANKARDEHGNILDWTPNDKGWFIKGLFRPTLVLGTYDEDGTHIENGVQVSHKKGDLKLDENGDPYYEKLGDREIYGKETLHYWDTITRDDSVWNKIDFMDSDGLTKSIGGTVMRTAFSLLPYFTPIGPYLGYVGAAIALGQTLPVLSKGLEGILVGSTDNAFGRTMSSLEATMDRFKHSQSRDAMGKFLSFENIGDIVASSAGQLFQQRMIANIPNLLRKSKDATTALATSKLGRNLSLGYMITTSANDAYETFKEAGATDRMAGIGLLGVTTGLALLMNNNYFKDMLFTGTFMDEDIAARDTIKQLVKESTVEPMAEYAAMAPKAMSKYQQKLANTWLYKKIEKNIVKNVKSWLETLKETRPTVGMVEKAIATDSKDKIGLGMKASMYLNRALNEGLEETMEEGVVDAMKLVTMGLDAMGIKVSKPDQNLDFGLTLRDALSRYGASFLGGAIGGAVFEGFNQFEGGEYDSLLEKSLAERLVWYERNGYGQEIRDRIKRLYKQGKLGNANLSSKGTKIKDVDGKDVIIYGQGNENDNQNLFTYNVINSYLDRLSSAIDNNRLFADNKIFDEILKSVRERHQDDDEDPEVMLYHFLEDMDTAKALTITQMGFLNAVKQDADKLSFDILRKANEIETVKQKIRKDNNLTDADSAKEEKLFKDSLLLKTLEDELKEMRDAWDAILKGERNGYYMGYAQMMASKGYSNWYTNPKALLNQEEEFPKTNIDNWSKYRYGIEYSKVTEEELKKKIEDDWNAFNTLMDSSETETEKQIDLWRKKSRALYDAHIKFSEKFAPDILNLGEQLKEKSTIDPFDFFTQEASLFGQYLKDSVGNNSALENLKVNLEALNKETDPKMKQDLRKVVISQFMTDAFSGPDSYKLKIKFLKQLDESIPIHGYIGLDIWEIRKEIFKSIVAERRTILNNEPDKNAVIGIPFIDPIHESFEEKLINDEEFRNKFIDSLSDEEQSYFSDKLENYLNEEDETIKEAYLEELIPALIDVEDNRRPLLDKRSEAYMIDLNIKLNGLLDAIESNSSDIVSKYDDLTKFISDNSKSFGDWDTEFTEQDVTKLIEAVIGEGVLETILNEQTSSRILNENPLAELLKKFDAYTGSGLFNIIETLTKEEEFQKALDDPNSYTVTSKTRENELLTALSFLNVITAIMSSSLDGINETYNLSKPEIQLAVLDQSVAKDLDRLILQLVNRINSLLDISKLNKRRMPRTQKEVMITVNKKRVEQLVNIGEIDFNGQKINFKEEWEKENYELSDATLEKAEAFDKAFRNWESRISKRLQEIASQQAKTDIVNGFIKPLFDKFGPDVYLQQTGELSNESDLVIPPYAQAMYLLTITELDSSTFNSIWKTLTINNPDLIPLFGQEYLVRENLASIISTKDGGNLFYLFHQYLKDNFPKKRSDGSSWDGYDYLDGREVLQNFINTDGIGGSGKTYGVDYLTNEAAKLYFDGNVSAIALGGTDQAAEGVHSALRLGTDSTKAMSFNEFMKLICTDDDGKILFDYTDDGGYFTKLVDKKVYNQKLKRNKSGEVVDKNGNTLAKINVKKLEELFTTKDGARLIYFDETGLIHDAQALLLHEIAKIHNIFIIGSGDTLQNKAKIGKFDRGIEDLIYHRTPALTVSMRSENNGVYKNIEIIKNILRKARSKVVDKDPSSALAEFNTAVGDELNAIKGPDGIVKLIYSDKTQAGHHFIQFADALGIAKKMLENIDKLKETDPNHKHQLAIVVDLNDTTKVNHYRNAFKDRDDVIIIDPISVQGKEYDFVIVDKSFDKNNKYILVQDFYTMITRARRGTAIVDDSNAIRDIGINSRLDETASEDVSGSSPEEKAELFKEYIEWRISLMQDIPEFTKKSGGTSSTPTPPPAPEPPKKPGSKTPTSTEETPTTVEEPVIAGVEDDFDPNKASNEEIVDHYIQKVKEKGGYHAQSLSLREAALKSSNAMTDIDLLITKLKDLEDDFFETNSLSIARNAETDIKDIRFANRVVIATIARAILNNKDAEGRKNYIKDAAEYLQDKYLGKLQVGINFLADLQRSFDGDGFFFYDKQYIYYSFTSDGEQYAIPVSIHSREDLSGSIFKNIQFEIKSGAIPISSFGEIMSPTHDRISEIDGVIVGADHEAYVGVSTISSTLWEHLQKIRKETRDDVVWRAVNYVLNNSGKSMIACNAASSKFKTGDTFFKPRVNADGNYTSAVDQEYGTEIMDSALVALQQLTTLNEWFEVIGILNSYARKQTMVNGGDEKLSTFFHLPGTNISEAFNFNSEDSGAIVENYKVLGQYSVLNHEAVNNLASAVFRYLAANPGTKWGSQYLQGFTKWLQKIRSNEESVHERGFSIQFKTKSEDNVTTHKLTIVPQHAYKRNDKNEIISYDITGYKVLYSNSNRAGFIEVYSTNDSKSWQLFDGVNYNFVQAIQKVFALPGVAESSVKLDIDQINNMINSGTMIIFPVDMMYSAKTYGVDQGLPVRTYSVYESDIYGWMNGDGLGPNETKYQITQDDITSLEDFLTKDTIFKHSFYRNIKAQHDDENLPWSPARTVTLQNSYIDIVKMLAPVYQILNTSSLNRDTDEYKELRSKLNGFFETSEDIDGKYPAIEPTRCFVNFKNGFIVFGEPQIVNAAWLKENATDVDNINNISKYEIVQFNPSTNQIVLETGEKFTLSNAGKDNFLDAVNDIVVGIKDKINASIVTSIDGKSKLVGNVLTINDSSYNNAELIGVDGNTYYFAVANNNIVSMNISDKEASKLSKVNKIKERGTYIGVIGDQLYTKHLYLNGKTLYIKDLSPDSEADVTIDLDALEFTDSSVIIDGNEITNPTIVNKLKLAKERIVPPSLDNLIAFKYANSDVYLTFGEHAISSNQLKMLVVNPEVTDGQIYHILAYDKSRIGYYVGDDLSTFKWGEINNFDTSSIKINTTTANETLSDPENPAEFVMNALETEKQEAINQFADPNSDLDVIKYSELKNGAVVTVKESDIDQDGITVKQKRAIRKWLSNHDSDINDLIIYKNKGEENLSTIYVEYSSNGNKKKLTVKIDNAFNVIVQSNTKMTTLEQTRSEFESALAELESEFNKITELQNSGTLTSEQSNDLIKQKNELSPILTAMQNLAIELKKDLDAQNDRVISESLDALPGIYGDVASKYVDAIEEQLHC